MATRDDKGSSSRTILGLFTKPVVHMLIVSFVAPCLACGTFNIVEVDWRDAPIPVVLLGSFLFAPILVFFTSFVFIPFGMITLLVCALYSQSVTNSQRDWHIGVVFVVGGAMSGVLLGCFFADGFVHGLFGFLGGLGCVIGAVMGVALWGLWSPRPSESKRPLADDKWRDIDRDNDDRIETDENPYRSPIS